MTTAITGTTGRIGAQVLDALAGGRDDLVQLVRDPSRAPHPDRTEVRVASYADPDAARRALAGVDTLFMVSAGEAQDRVDQHRAFVAAAAEAGVERIVYTSFVGASVDAVFTLGRDHGATEEAIRESGMRATILRDNFYLDFVPLFAGEDGVIRGPAGQGRFAGVARADVADAAAAVLRDPEAHAGAVYTLTGPEALTMAEAAARASAVLGRPLRYEEETVEEAYASRRSFTDAQWQLDAWVSTYTSIRDGECAEVTGDVERLTGHPARTIEQALSPRS